MEREAQEFYAAAAGSSSDVPTRKLLGDLAAAEARHKVSPVNSSSSTSIRRLATTKT